MNKQKTHGSGQRPQKRGQITTKKSKTDNTWIGQVDVQGRKTKQNNITKIKTRVKRPNQCINNTGPKNKIWII